MADAMGVSYDDFIRTTEERHKVSCAELWRRIAANGDIYLGHYEGWYAVRDEAFYDESEADDAARTARRWRRAGAPVEWVREPSYFFRLSAWQDRLLKLYEEQSGFHRAASRRNEVISFVRGGLTRSVDQPHDVQLGHSGAGRARARDVCLAGRAEQLRHRAAASRTRRRRAGSFWPADVHFVGKDIIRFHAVYWPAFLMAAGLPVPKRVTSQRLVAGRRREDVASRWAT